MGPGMEYVQREIDRLKDEGVTLAQVIDAWQGRPFTTSGAANHTIEQVIDQTD